MRPVLIAALTAGLFLPAVGRAQAPAGPDLHGFGFCKATDRPGHTLLVSSAFRYDGPSQPLMLAWINFLMGRYPALREYGACSVTNADSLPDMQRDQAEQTAADLATLKRLYPDAKAVDTGWVPPAAP